MAGELFLSRKLFSIEAIKSSTPEVVRDKFKKAFNLIISGTEAETQKWGWMGSTNSDSLTLDSTDVTDPRTIDLHIWKITITL